MEFLPFFFFSARDTFCVPGFLHPVFPLGNENGRQPALIPPSRFVATLWRFGPSVGLFFSPPANFFFTRAPSSPRIRLKSVLRLQPVSFPLCIPVPSRVPFPPKVGLKDVFMHFNPPPRPQSFHFLSLFKSSWHVLQDLVRQSSKFPPCWFCPTFLPFFWSLFFL